jgi:hypothetical protein
MLLKFLYKIVQYSIILAIYVGLNITKPLVHPLLIEGFPTIPRAWWGPT